MDAHQLAFWTPNEGKDVTLRKDEWLQWATAKLFQACLNIFWLLHMRWMVKTSDDDELITWTNRWWSQSWRNAFPKLSVEPSPQGPGCYACQWCSQSSPWCKCSIQRCTFTETVLFVLNLKSCDISWMREEGLINHHFANNQSRSITFYDLSFFNTWVFPEPYSPKSTLRTGIGIC